MKRGWLILFFVLLFGAVGYLFWETRPAVQLASAQQRFAILGGEDSVVIVERIVSRENVRAPKVPEYMVFAGDTIRFDRVDMRERMDRELIAFTYGHTNSLLMLKRSRRIFPQVEPILAAQGVPDDLKYLMAIESNSAASTGREDFMSSTSIPTSLGHSCRKSSTGMIAFPWKIPVG